MNAHSWTFFRAGGFDQVTLDTAADLTALRSLDQKLWVALACPVAGLQFDADTLGLIDQDADGRIRAPEILEAVEWMQKVLKDVGELTQRRDGLPLASLDESTPEGASVAVTARRVASELPEATTALKVEHTSQAARIFAAMAFNGDGVLPEASVDDADEKAVLLTLLETVGGEPDASGADGITIARLDAFVAAANDYVAWSALSEADPARLLPLGDATASAAAAIAAVEDKAEDFFTRCELAAFDARATEALSRPASDWVEMAGRSLHDTDADIAAFPLASIQVGGAVLPLKAGVNPAWRSQMQTLRLAAVVPILGDRDTLTRDDWNQLTAHVAAHREWVASCQGELVAPVGVARLREILAGPHLERLRTLIGEDETRRPEAQAIQALDRAARYYRDLHRLLDNFVSFRDFYVKREKAVFQAGTLYLDGRSCDLVMKVQDVARHTALASNSHAYLAYCSAVRCGGTERMNIVAAFTGGDSDFLAVGRNGIFYDRQGNDWDATITSVIENPISIRQAFWTPYKKVARLISEQMERFAAAKNSAIDAQAGTGVGSGATQLTAAQPAAPSAFDAGKFAGIFAAVGLALGVIGTALAAAIGGFLALRVWQMPLAIIGILLLISAPSMLMAALKLRQRNLAPLLDASGWAINARARINIPFGASLTSVARLPDGATHTQADPFKDKKSPLGLILTAVAFVCLLAILWDSGVISGLFNSIATSRQNAIEAAEASGAAEGSATPPTEEPAPAPAAP